MKITVYSLSILAVLLLNPDGRGPVLQKNGKLMASTKKNTLRIKLALGDRITTALLENNPTTIAFGEMLPIDLLMRELNGNEKYADLPDDLPIDPFSPGMIQAGDIMLYGSRTLVIFYKSFATPYSYTRLGHIEDLSALDPLPEAGNIRVGIALNN